MKKKRKLGRNLLSFLLTLAMVVGLVPGMGMTTEAATIQYDDYLVEVTNHNQNFIDAGICDQTTGLKCKPLSVETARALENYLKSKTGSKVAVIYGCTIRDDHPGWSRISFVIDGTTAENYYMDAPIARAISNRGARNEAEYKLFYVNTDAPDFETANETVTFKVINGQWDDGTTEDVTVSLSGLKDEIRLAADQIPAVGTKPNDTYKAGSWDVTPSTDTAITEATTYTYTYVAKEASVVTKAPEAKTLTYNGSAQELVTAGTATGGEMQYALGTKDAAAEEYTTDIPARTDAGTYYVWYKVVGDDNHNDSDAACVKVTIAEKKDDADTVAKPEYKNTSGAGSVWTLGSTGTLTFTFSRSENDSETIKHFAGAKVDGTELGSNDYSFKSGSVIIDLKADYLNKLSAGKHTLTAMFDDGDDVTVEFTIKEKASEGGKKSDTTPDNKKSDVTPGNKKVAKTDAPRTGDAVNLKLIFIVMILSMCGIFALCNLRSKLDEKKRRR